MLVLTKKLHGVSLSPKMTRSFSKPIAKKFFAELFFKKATPPVNTGLTNGSTNPNLSKTTHSFAIIYYTTILSRNKCAKRRFYGVHCLAFCRFYPVIYLIKNKRGINWQVKEKIRRPYRSADLWFQYVGVSRYHSPFCKTKRSVTRRTLSSSPSK